MDAVVIGAGAACLAAALLLGSNALQLERAGLHAIQGQAGGGADRVDRVVEGCGALESRFRAAGEALARLLS